MFALLVVGWRSGNVTRWLTSRPQMRRLRPQPKRTVLPAALPTLQLARLPTPVVPSCPRRRSAQRSAAPRRLRRRLKVRLLDRLASSRGARHGLVGLYFVTICMGAHNNASPAQLINMLRANMAGAHKEEEEGPPAKSHAFWGTQPVPKIGAWMCGFNRGAHVSLGRLQAKR